MPPKRAPSFSPSSSESEDSSPPTAKQIKTEPRPTQVLTLPVTPNQTLTKHTTSSAKDTTKPSVKSKVASPGNGVWTPQIRGEIMDRIIGLGYKNADLDAWCQEFGFTKKQLVNQLQPGRSNLRSKAVKFVGEE